MTFAGEADLLAQLRPDKDGLIIEQVGRRATFLPQVWETLPEPARFLAELKRKAGLPADSGDEGLRAWRYTVDKWAEADSR
jgi:AMMECR1 domain-containing protein